MAEAEESSKESKLRSREAFESLQAEIAAVPPERVLKVNLDIPTVVGTVITKFPRLCELLPEIRRHMPLFDAARLERLEGLALALFYAHGAYLVANEPPRSLEEVFARGLKVRKILMGDAMAQAGRDIFDEKRLEEIRAGSGYRDLGEDLIALVNLYRGRWADVEGTTGVKPADLELAELLAAQLVVGAEERESAPVAKGQAIETRARVFTLLVRAYNDARRAALYLRAEEEDADTFAPSLYAGRARPKEESVPEAPKPPVETAPVAGQVEQQEGQGDGDAAKASSIKVGMPGSSPYTE